jgi:CubicO group peptidase (beta-lactamase class C family)
VIVARKGIVVFHKTYGYHTYDARIGVEKKDLYDLASVTKVSGPLSGLMWLESRGKFSHQGRLGDYIPAMKGSDKADLELRDILSHKAGLYPWIPYWERTVKKSGHYKRRFLRTAASDPFSLAVADRVYLKSDYKKRIYREIRKSELGENTYLYSGLSFFLFPEMIEHLSDEPYEAFLYHRIYRKLGAWDLVFRPHRFYTLSQIVPTEYDSLFRKQLVHGYVHDEGAAMMVGYSGNAGLFATANDLLKLFEMYRRMGNYGGEQIIAEEVMKTYTSYQFPEENIRRGLGFDKPLLNEFDATGDDYPCPGASASSFGHSGFTGTFAWVDPEHEVSYVFLSNRVHPTRNNQLLYEMNIRTDILQSVLDSILEP